MTAPAQRWQEDAEQDGERDHLGPEEPRDDPEIAGLKWQEADEATRKWHEAVIAREHRVQIAKAWADAEAAEEASTEPDGPVGGAS